MNLLKSDLFRLFKEKTLYVLAGIVVAFALLKCFITSMMLGENGTYLLGDAILQGIGLDSLGTVTAIGISLYNGKEFANNTIRNKICYGESRYKIFIVKLIINWMMAIAFFLISIVAASIAGAFLFEHTLGEEFWAKVFCQLLLLLGFSALITCIANVTKSMKVSLIFSIAAFVCLHGFSFMLPQMGDNIVIKVLCQSVYMMVSTMLLSSQGGVYQTTNGNWQNPITITYDNIYLNCILIGIIYTVVSIVIALIVIRKQDYK